MDRARTMPRLCFLMSVALTLVGVVLRSVCMLTRFDAEVGYFDEGWLVTLSHALYFVAVAAAIVCAALIPKSTLPTELHTQARFPVALALGLSLAAFTVASFVACYPTRTSEVMLAPTLLGLLASTYFFVSGNRGGRYPDWLSAIGFIPVFWCIAAVAETYTDQFTTMNSPVKVSLQMGFLGLMLICLAELRFRLGKAMPRCAVAFFGMGIFLCLNAAVPVLLGTGAHLLDNILHMLYAVVLLCGGLYGIHVLFQYTFFPAEVAAEVVDCPEGEAEPANEESTPDDSAPTA